MKQLSLPIKASLVIAIILSLIGLIFIWSNLNELKILREHTSKNNIALNDIFTNERLILSKMDDHCIDPINPFLRKSCQQKVAGIYKGSGDIAKDKTLIRDKLSSNGWHAHSWKSEGATVFYDETISSVKGSLAEGGAVRNDSSGDDENHTSQFAVVFMENIEKEFDLLRLPHSKTTLSENEMMLINGSNAKYFIIASVESHYKGSY